MRIAPRRFAIAAAIAAAVAAPFAVACHAGPSEAAPIVNGASQAVRSGQEVHPTGSDAFGVALLSVLQDSRCPRAVVCVSAGTAEIVIGYRYGMGPTVPVTLRWGASPRDTLIGTVRVVFDSLTPYPTVPGPLLAQDRYIAWLSFKR
ncbi:hypothetical protein [Gemmatimonas sp.]|uniref:hypothetical protein n=1 Tax=Gemmatimonas sp. TaxID=1962908 RepID=UPI00286D6808|nr:hypothetical protein [Gemmatimonas sp.]